MISKNYGRDTGIQKITYGPQLEAVKAGATPIKDVNSNHLTEFANAVQTAINNGQTGNQLNQTIINQFGTPTAPEKTSTR